MHVLSPPWSSTAPEPVESQTSSFVAVSVRPLHQSVRPSPVFLVLVGVTMLGGALAWQAAATVRPIAYVGVFVFVIAGWLVSLSLHEFGHAYTAWRFGDQDVAVRGYLTLNPFKYSSPLLSIGLPLLFIALGGIGLAVEVGGGDLGGVPDRKSVV